MRLAPVLHRPTLVLNRDWTPIQTTTIRHAIGLVANGAARIIDPLTYEAHDLTSWNAVSRARDRFAGSLIRSMRLALEPPEVIVLTAYHGLGKRSVVFSRGNLFRRDHFSCQYCGLQPGTRELTIDHILPRSRGGKSTWENCVVACFQCNCAKADRTPEEARMTLRRPPHRPCWSTILPGPSRNGLESWKRFLSDAYWEVELEP